MILLRRRGRSARKWLATNPAEDAERITLKRSGDFKVLSPAEVDAIARAAHADQDAAIFLTAAYAGLRRSALRASSIMDVAA